MSNYAGPIPKDQGGATLDGYPEAEKAVVQWNVTNQVASSVININPNTTGIGITATAGQGVVIRWVPVTETAVAAGAKASVVSSGLGANFDHHIQPNQIRRFVIPREQMGKNGQAGSVHGLYQRLAWINAGSGTTSILATEF